MSRLKWEAEKADAAERRVIEELRQMGNEALMTWAQNSVTRCATEMQAESQGRSGGKKNCTGTRRSEKSR